jgi:hypothetical protein
VELLLEVGALKLLAAARGVTRLETRGDKLLLERGGDFVTLGGRFPRLTRREPRARLREIRQVLLALVGRPPPKPGKVPDNAPPPPRDPAPASPGS